MGATIVTGTDHPAVVDTRALHAAESLGRVESLAALVEAKDAETGRHLYRSALLASACLESIDPYLAMEQEILFGFVLHDVGKVAVPDRILKKPGPLSSAEWSMMRRHPENGVQIAERSGFTSLTTDVILAHHERWDGAGYPFGLIRTEIPLSARVFAVADSYDAMTSRRPYRPALSKSAAKAVIAAGAGTRFDPQVVTAFLDLLS
jgi:HD-GYP domain-containing protein (c-di-GMP phosphodiesterase class II)